MREKAKKDLKRKPSIIRFTIAQRKMADKLSIARGENLSEFFRRLLKEEDGRVLYKPHKDKMEAQNRKLQQMIDVVEKSFRAIH